MIHASRLYAAAALSEPGSRQAREALPTLREDERILQLCNLEAMEQVGRFRSHDRWYNIKFECVVSHDHEAVVDFAFWVGDQIPPSQWESHGLTAATGPDD